MEFKMNQKIAKGLTLIELLVAITILSIASLSALSMSNLLIKQRLRSNQSELHLLINRARSDALTRNSRMTLCQLSPDNHCQQQWAGILSVFTDGNGNRSLDPQEAELYRIEIHPKVLVRWQGMKPTNSLHFSPSGITFVSNGTFTLCSQNDDEALKLIINRQGRIRTERSLQS